MARMGLRLVNVVPRYKKKDRSGSLTSQCNRHLDNCDFDGIKLTEETKRTLISYVVQLMILQLTSITCYI